MFFIVRGGIVDLKFFIKSRQYLAKYKVWRNNLPDEEKKKAKSLAEVKNQMDHK